MQQAESLSKPEEAFDGVIASARSLKQRYVDSQIDWYENHSRWPRITFRFAGVLTIGLSVVLPVLAVADFPFKATALSLASIVIAALSSLNSFFRWERTWRGNRTAQAALQQHVAKWELELTRARLLLTGEDRLKGVYQATDDLLTNARSVVSSESEGFFSSVQFPQQSAPPK